jgi:serine/threonine protein kinase/Tfp pilus assembly protein PilF
MIGWARAPSWAEIDPFIQTFEDARARGAVSLSDHLPSASHPHFIAILCELVRIDLEFGWAAGQPRPLAEYLDAFPALAANDEYRAQAAFEEYRLRQQAGEHPLPTDYASRFAVDTSGWPASTPAAVTANGQGSTLNGRAEHRAMPTVVDAPTPATASDAAGQRGASTAEPDANAPADLRLTGSSVADRLVQVLAFLQEPQNEFLGFHIRRELGNGAFGRVYLARQGDLANRDVVLKLSGDLRGEPQTLARLQHTNIVPIYSVHRLGPLHAFCMPYFGATTFARLLAELHRAQTMPASGSWFVDQLPPAHDYSSRGRRELASRDYVSAVLWLGLRLADGLAYAHERGVVHQDLKPANLLLADDGEPMLLDFNLALDPAIAGQIPPGYIGGTLPYMSPERLAAFAASQQHTDPRDDLYALGLILYELLTGRAAFAIPKAADTAEVVRQLTEARRQPLPDARKLNRAITPAVEAILGRCLAPDPAHRYQSARELSEDITRHLGNLPLKYAPNSSLRERFAKWRRRNPRLASAYTAAALAGVLLVASFGLVVWQNRELAHTQSINNLHAFRSELSASRLLLKAPAPTRRDVEAGVKIARQAADRYGLSDQSLPDVLLPAIRLDPDTREALREDFAELGLIMSRGEEFLARLSVDEAARRERFESAFRFNEMAERFSRDNELVNLTRRHRADLFFALGRVDQARALRERTSTTVPGAAKNLRTLAAERMAKGEFAEAANLLKQANRTDPQNPLGLMLLGYCYERLKAFPKAVGCYDAVLALCPESHTALYRRAAAHAESGEHADAIEDFSAALHVQPDYMPAYLDRALSYAATGNHREALVDLDRVLDFPDAPTRVYFLRAQYRSILGDRVGATADRKEGLRREPNDEPSWLARGIARLPADPRGALADFEKALVLNPRSLDALQDKASVLSEFLSCPKEAIQTLDAALDVDPKHVPALIGRAVLRARLGSRSEAHRDARAALELSTAPAVQYQAACVFALTSTVKESDRSEAIRLLEAALRGGFGREELVGDSDLNPIRKSQEFEELIKKYGESAKMNRK